MIRLVAVALPLVLFAVGPVLLLLSRSAVGELPFAATVLADGGALLSTLAVSSGAFAIFYPEDAHAPLATSGPIHKAVVKVAVD